MFPHPHHAATSYWSGTTANHIEDIEVERIQMQQAKAKANLNTAKKVNSPSVDSMVCSKVSIWTRILQKLGGAFCFTATTDDEPATDDERTPLKDDVNGQMIWSQSYYGPN